MPTKSMTVSITTENAFQLGKASLQQDQKKKEKEDAQGTQNQKHDQDPHA